MGRFKVLPSHQALRQNAARAIFRIPAYPSHRHSGRGIVICAGGPSYFVQAWVTVRLLRELGCELPIQLWYRDSGELTPTMRHLLESCQVECVNAQAVARDQGTRRLPGWAIKPFAIIHSRFREVLYLDSDSVPVRDPEYLFRDPSYANTGSLFWTDRFRGSHSAYATVHPEAWSAMNVPHRDEPECESGQLIVDKSIVWRELNLCLYFNQCAESYYRFLYGDKDTFRFAWHRLGRRFNTVPFGPSSPPNFRVLFQLDPAGSVVFQHRARAKWTVRGRNRSILGFQHESSCLEFLHELDQHWDQIMDEWQHGGSEAMRTLRTTLAQEPEHLCFVNGCFAGAVTLMADGNLSSAVKQLPTHWQIVEQPDGALGLALMGDRAAPLLLESRHGGWFGQRIAGRRELICLVPPRLAPIDGKTPRSDQERYDGFPWTADAEQAAVHYDCELLHSGQSPAHHLVLQVEANGRTPAHRSTTPETGESAGAPSRGCGASRFRPHSAHEPNGVAETDSALRDRSVKMDANADHPPSPHSGNGAGIDLARLALAFDNVNGSPTRPSSSPPPSPQTYAEPYGETVPYGETIPYSDADSYGETAPYSAEPLSHQPSPAELAEAIWSGGEAGLVTPAGAMDAPDAVQAFSAHAHRSAPGTCIKIYGMPRTCTNLIAHLVRRNFHASVFSNQLGWKHGPNLWRAGDEIGGRPLKFIICVKHIYAWLVSFYRFETQGHGLACSFPDFVRGTTNTYEERNPIDCYNLLVRMWLGLAVNAEHAQVVRAETLLTDQAATLESLERQLCLRRRTARIQTEQRRIGPDERVRSRDFDPSYYEGQQFLACYNADLLSFVNQRIDHELMDALQYRLLDEMPMPFRPEPSDAARLSPHS